MARFRVDIYRDWQGPDDEPVGDFRRFCNGLTFTVSDNSIGTASFSTSLRSVWLFTREHNFSPREFFTPIRTSIKIRDTKNNIDVFGGVLMQTPQITFDSSGSDDYAVTFTFNTWGALTVNHQLAVINRTGPLNNLLVNALNEGVTASQIAPNPWPLTTGHIDTMATVSNPTTTEKSLSDYLLERTDNTSGAGAFHLWFNENAQMEIWRDVNFGTDVSSTTNLTYPSAGQKGGITSIDFPAWSNYFSNVILKGSGNGDAAITSTAVNSLTLTNTGYAQLYKQESDISVQATLDDKATAYLIYTNKPFSNPTISIARDISKNVGFILGDHRQGGTLWLGDTIGIKINNVMGEILPFDNPLKLRVKQIVASIDTNDDVTMSISFVDPTLIAGAEDAV